MSRFVRTLGCLAVWILILDVVSARADEPATSWRAGVARVDTTPIAPVRMAGYASRTSPSRGYRLPWGA